MGGVHEEHFALPDPFFFTLWKQLAGAKVELELVIAFPEVIEAVGNEAYLGSLMAYAGTFPRQAWCAIGAWSMARHYVIHQALINQTLKRYGLMIPWGNCRGAQSDHRRMPDAENRTSTGVEGSRGAIPVPPSDQ